MLLIYPVLFLDRMYQIYFSPGINLYGILPFGWENNIIELNFFFRIVSVFVHMSRFHERIHLVCFKHSLSNGLWKISMFLIKIMRSLISSSVFIACRQSFSSSSLIIMTCLFLYCFTSLIVFTITIFLAIALIERIPRPLRSWVKCI